MYPNSHARSREKYNSNESRGPKISYTTFVNRKTSPLRVIFFIFHSQICTNIMLVTYTLTTHTGAKTTDVSHKLRRTPVIYLIL